MVIDKKNEIKMLFGYAVFLILMFSMLGVEGLVTYLSVPSFLGLIALLLINAMTSSSGKGDKRFKSGYSKEPQDGILESWKQNKSMLYFIYFLLANCFVTLTIVFFI